MTSRFEVVHRGNVARASARSRCPAATTCSTRSPPSRWGSTSRCRSTRSRPALAGFAGVQRRFQIRGDGPGRHRGGRLRPPPRRDPRDPRRRQGRVRPPRRHGVPAAPLQPHAAPAAGVPHRLQPGGRARRHGHLCGRRGADPGRPRARSRRGHRAPTATATCSTWAATARRIVDHLCESTGPGTSCSPWAPATSAQLGAGAARRASARPGDVRRGDDMLGEIRGEVRFKEPLSFHTSLRIGGPADIFVVPQDVDDIRLALIVRRARAAAGGRGRRRQQPPRARPRHPRRRAEARGLPRPRRVPRRGGGGRRGREPVRADPRGGRR